MTAPRLSWRAWTALVAAYALVLQVLVAGLLLGATAGPAAADSIATAFCAAAASDRGPADGGADHRHLPPCCFAGCAMLAMATPPASAAVPAAPLAVAAAAPPSVHAPVARSHPFSPGRARAPPGANPMTCGRLAVA